jgi:hypothetical protein
VEGQVSPSDPFTAPQIRLIDVDVSSVGAVALGTCPVEITRVDVAGTATETVSCLAFQDFVVSGGTWTDLSSTYAYFFIDDYTIPIGVPAVTLSGVTLTGSPSSPDSVVQTVGTTVASVAIIDSTMTSFGRLVTMNSIAGATASVVDSTISNWSSTNPGAFYSYSSATIVIDHSTFSDGSRIVSDQLDSFTLRDSRVFDIQSVTASVDMYLASNITATGNSIENLAVVFDLEASSSNAGAASAYNLTGNNFIGTTDKVVRIVGTPNALTTRMDLDGSYFGAGIDTSGEIEALITDARTDVNPLDTVKGNTDYTGFVTAPLTLETP